MVFVFLWLHLVWWFLGHPRFCKWHYFVLLNGWVIFHYTHTHTHTHTHTPHTHYFFFIHSSVDGPLGSSHVLPTAESAAVNIEAPAWFSVVFSSGRVPRSGLLHSSIFSFLRNHQILFSIVALPTYFPINGVPLLLKALCTKIASTRIMVTDCF